MRFYIKFIYDIVQFKQYIYRNSAQIFFPVCFVFNKLLMMSQATSLTVACLALTNCEVTPRHIPKICV